MELTPAEAKLIKTLRAIDRNNPLGIGNFSEAGTIEHLQRIAEGMSIEAAAAYQTFIAEHRETPVIPLRALREAQQPQYRTP